MYAYNTYAPTTYPEHMDRIHIHTAYRTHIAYILYNVYIYIYDTACTQHRTYIHSTLCTQHSHIYKTYTHGPLSNLHPQVAAQGREERMERKDWDGVKNDKGR